MATSTDILSNLKELAAYLDKSITDALIAQGHVASGKLKDSIDVTVTRLLSGYEIAGGQLNYGRWGDRGRNAGIRRVPLDALINWIRIKKLDLRGNSEKSVAFMIQRAIYKNGIPTNRDQSKKRYISATLEKSELYIKEKIEQMFYASLEFEIANMIEYTNSNINSIALATR